MINTEFRSDALPTITSGNNKIIVTQNAIEDPFKLFYTDREGVWKVQNLAQGIIRDARSHEDFINSLGRFRGESSSENKKLKVILDNKRLHLTPKNFMDLAIQNISLEAAEVMFLINKGFLQIKQPVPENIQKDLVRLNLAVADLTKKIIIKYDR
ncbi:MAG: hypothetical protein H0X29_08820 [Parachlamydiaceae bacterium]|nr:hypothetical protein [Parachlamydiaceae bacterium]